jgi:hypothetical protein
MLKPNEAKAAKCRELAEQAKDQGDRERWFGMERFWLRQTGPDKMTPDSEALAGPAPAGEIEIVKL